MKKNKYDAPNRAIAEYIYNDYIYNQELYESNDMDEKLKLLIYNGLAWKISGTESLCSTYRNNYRVACKFIQKYNKTNKKYRRRLYTYEFGGKDSIAINNNDELLSLAKISLETGVYYCQMDDDNYAKLVVKIGSGESETDVSYEFYIIGKGWKEWKNIFLDMIDKYDDIINESDEDRICYTDGRPSTTAIFKPFSQVIMKDKEKLLSYIDNWVSNIPIYYDKYKMISKLSIMLYGKPGTGKSTVAKAIAKHLGITTVTAVSPDYFSYNDNESNSRHRKRSSYFSETVYTIDDIDCICKSREESDDKENAELLSSLLSFLDNPPTFFYHAKNGMDYPISIVIATTNYYDKLDEAVKRYGRFDLKIEMNEFNREQAEEMCKIYDLRLSDLVKNSYDKNFTISPSYLQALCLENIDKSLKSVNK